MSETERELMEMLHSGLMAFGFGTESALGVMRTLVGYPEEIWELMRFMASNQKATELEIVRKAVEIRTSKSNMISSRDLNFPKTDI